MTSELLRPNHLAELEQSGISPELIAEAGLRSVTDVESYNFGFRNGGSSTCGLLFPFTDPTTWRLSKRFSLLKPDAQVSGRKYLSPVGETLRLYLVPGLTDSHLKDASIPVWIVEGIKKSLAVETWRLRDGRPGVVVGISGCWGWRRKIKGLLPNGTIGKVGSEPIPDLDLLMWEGREVWICLDGDAITNKRVGQAERALVKELKTRGAIVHIVRIPPVTDGSRRGADDFLVQEGDEAWAGLLDGADPARPTIIISTDVPTVVDLAADALRQHARGIYQRGRTLVHIVREEGRPRTWLRRPEGAAMIAELGEHGTLEQLAAVADWKTGKKNEPALPPKWAVSCLLSRKQWHGIRYLEGIITAPTLRPDGTILEAPGYDAGTGLLYLPGGVSFPTLPAQPTQEEARVALRDLVAPFLDFLFVQDAGKSATIAAILTMLGRHAIEGPCPLFAVRSTTPGSGKGLLVDACCLIATGRTPARTTAPRGKHADSEWRKRIFALALEGDQAVLIDNVDGSLGSPPRNLPPFFPGLLVVWVGTPSSDLQFHQPGNHRPGQSNLRLSPFD